ncbi:MAG: hypothetical protein LBG83_07865 [Oscillospiraceae bacterium]|jgi:hypothetical protein|nr:hypothetical protein [Oscillospiraceae bacterium]
MKHYKPFAALLLVIVMLAAALICAPAARAERFLCASPLREETGVACNKPFVSLLAGQSGEFLFSGVLNQAG